jgi:hypothetical protein
MDDVYTAYSTYRQPHTTSRIPVILKMHHAMTAKITECSRLPINRGRIILGLSSDNCLVCPVSRNKLEVKFIFGKKQLQFEGSFISRLDMYFETREGFLCLVSLHNVYTAQALLKYHTHVSTSRVQITHTYIYIYIYIYIHRFINPNS